MTGLCCCGPQKLSLSYCDVGAVGAGAIAKLVGTPSCVLVQLDLCGNHIGSDGLLVIAQALLSNKKLTALLVADNMLGVHADLGVVSGALRALADVMKSPETVLETVRRGGAGGGGKTQTPWRRLICRPTSWPWRTRKASSSQCWGRCDRWPAPRAPAQRTAC